MDTRSSENADKDEQRALDTYISAQATLTELVTGVGYQSLGLASFGDMKAKNHITGSTKIF
jgi:hypothetical protein